MQLLVVWSSEMERKREERRSQHHSLGTPRLAGGRRDLMTWQCGIISNSVGAAINRTGRLPNDGRTKHSFAHTFENDISRNEFAVM